MHLSMRSPVWLLIALGMYLSAYQPALADCRYRTLATGATQYRCDDGRSGELRRDATDIVHDSATGTTWRTDATGTVRGSDGTRYRTDSTGTVHSNDGVSWRRDAAGNLRGSDGTLCRKIAGDQIQCSIP